MSSSKPKQVVMLS